MQITIVTGNPGKVREIRAMAMGRLDFSMQNLDLPEIQSLDLKAIVTEKLMHAYKDVKGPVIVDDVSAGLDCLEGLPGPFIKFFNQKLGDDSLWKLANARQEKVTVCCMAAYYDGKKTLFGEGIIHGMVVSPRGTNGFGFDMVVIPDGHTQTMAEMTEPEKMKISHRGLAFRDLLEQIERVE